MYSAGLQFRPLKTEKITQFFKEKGKVMYIKAPDKTSYSIPYTVLGIDME